MQSRDFCFWLQGYFELAGNNVALTQSQTEAIKNHLNLVFYHEIDPSYTSDKNKQKEMQAIHDGKKPKEATTSQWQEPHFVPHSSGNVFPRENNELLRC